MTVKVGLVQMACASEPSTNLGKAIDGVREAARRGARIICLPELFLGPYFCQTEDYSHFALAEAVPGPTTGRMSELAGELGVVLVVPVFERRAPGVYHNSAAVIDADGRYLGKYRKMHIPDDPRYLEKFYFTPGDLGFPAWDTRFGRIGVLICWDQWYPEAARLAAMDGAQILFYPTAIGWHPSEIAELGETQRSSWETIQRGHAIANGVFVAAVNRVGHEGPASGGLEFWGTSFVAAPGGKVLERASSSQEEILVVPCELSEVDSYRTHWPFLRDRRIDSYGEITKRLLD